MKKYFPGVTLTAAMIGSAGLVAGTMTAHAQDATPADTTPIYVSEHGFYVGAGVGVNWASQLVDTFNLFGTAGNSQVSLNAGVSGYLSTGYSFRLNKHLSIAPELEVGVMYNTFGNGQGGFTGSEVNTTGGGNIVQVPVLANVVLTYNFTPRWSVYGGIGVGVMYTDVSVSNNSLTDLEGDFGSPAIEAKLGVKCKLGPGDLGVGYKFVENIGGAFEETINNNVIEGSYTIHF
jgi:opacity protein-like surface antigen